MFKDDSGMPQVAASTPAEPLSADEVVALFRSRWQASYDMQIVTRRRRL